MLEYHYSAFGELLNKSNDYSGLLKELFDNNIYIYKGYCYDYETGLYYCNSRYYNSEIGRWASPDNIDYLDPESINGLNLYVYCANNPVMNYDPTGHSFLGFLAVMAIGWAVTTIASNLFGAHLVGGISSTVGGIQTIGLGLSLFAFGPVGWALGSIALLSGGLSIAFGTAELQEHFTGNNWMKSGLGDGLYTGLMIGNAIVGAAVSIGGIKYMNSMHGQRAYAYQNVGKYKYTQTVVNKVGRPYTYDVSKQRMVIKNGTMSVDNVSSTSIFAGGRNFKFVYGDWSLNVSNTYRTIYHFLYAGSITGMY